MFRRILIPFSTQKNWKTKQTSRASEQMFYLSVAHTQHTHAAHTQKQANKHIWRKWQRCQPDTHKCTAISAPNSFRCRKGFPPSCTLTWFSPIFIYFCCCSSCSVLCCVHTNFAAFFSCYNITKKYIYTCLCVWGRVDCLSKRTRGRQKRSLAKLIRSTFAGWEIVALTPSDFTYFCLYIYIYNFLSFFLSFLPCGRVNFVFLFVRRSLIFAYFY